MTLLRIAAAALALLAGTAFAQENYPNRPITLIVPWPAGGSTDTHLRKLGELASTHLGPAIILEH
jgi:tripartite-type tricarboxylate transporter receptor subunit TctC